MEENKLKDCKSRVAVVLPSLDPDEKFIAVVKGLTESGFEHIVIVDDGSDEAHQHFFDEAESFSQCAVLHHGVNKGKGRALKTAFEYVRNSLSDLDGVITIDGDGQHALEDIVRCGEKMLEMKDKVVLGCRNFDLPGIPPRSVTGNKSTSRMFRIFCGIKLSDTQTGLRAIPAKYLEKFCAIQGERFEYETNMLLQMKAAGIAFFEQPIATIYDSEDYSSHYHAVKDSLRISKVMAKYLFFQPPVRYLISSVTSWVIDNALYLAFFSLFTGLVAKTLISPCAHVAGRVFSSVANFNMNNFYVFRAKGGYWRAFLKYYCLCLPQTAVSLLLVSWAVSAVGSYSAGSAVLMKVIIEGVLFCISYVIQKKWVFKSTSEKT